MLKLSIENLLVDNSLIIGNCKLIIALCSILQMKLKVN